VEPIRRIEGDLPAAIDRIVLRPLTPLEREEQRQRRERRRRERKPRQAAERPPAEPSGGLDVRV
jgi:hypothetical protein